MTNLAERRIYNMPDTFKAINLYRVTPAGFTEFGFGWAYKLASYFNCEPAASVNYEACLYDNRTRIDGTLTVTRNGDFTFTPV